ncbi:MULTISPECIES: fimbria/pilus outer membrane usher protein [Marinobacter]|uniref:fimbria/pilus outer membrane usher protein n=1 Tax=Marinobacter TaxID=2742 RepID=UPI003B430B13|nr:fimbrial biogenesis outer membrane usher protein [Marinobacter alkaliphilus]
MYRKLHGCSQCVDDLPRRNYALPLLVAMLACNPFPAYAGVAGDSVVTQHDEYVFDDSMLIGTALGAGGIGRFNRHAHVDPGQYRVDLRLNGNFLGRFDVLMVEAEHGRILPCLDRSILIGAGVLPEHISHEDEGSCLMVEKSIESASTEFDAGALALAINVPQSLMRNTPRGYVDPNLLDSGASMVFANYSASHFRVDRDGGASNSSSFGSLNAGVNAGLWRFRSQSNLSVDDRGETRWSGARNYVQRALPTIQSELTMGDSYTSGRQFGGVAYRGFELSSDQRMLPSSQRGYAPVVRGVANTNARVSIRQNGRVIYQTTVPAGSFEISDLYPTSFNGDLEVEVLEADGAVRRFNVPFSSVPGSLRPGQSRYSLAGGLAREIGDGDDPFGELVYEYGLSNRFTLNGGVQGASGYESVTLGGVLGSSIGAFGLDFSYSSAELPSDGRQEGLMGRASYSRSFSSTGTNFSLATYRYSTRGYRSLSEVLLARHTDNEGAASSSSIVSQRSRFDMSVSQHLTDRSSLYANAITRDYYDTSRGRDYEYQLGYSHRFANRVNLNMSANRQEVGSLGTGDENRDHSLTVSLSMPLGTASNSPSFSLSANQNRGGDTSIQGAVSGVAGDDLSTGYGVYASRDTAHNSTEAGVNVQHRFSKGTLAGNYAQGRDYWQAGASATGGVVVHGGGITFGPYLSDTFALVEAKGAEGARVRNANGVTIDSNGYAIVPSLSPYRYNHISLDPVGIDTRAELQETSRQVAPYAGASVYVPFRVTRGRGALITAKRDGGAQIPMGATVVNESGDVVGMVGQASQVYGRLEQDAGVLTVRWGEGSSHACSLPYELPPETSVKTPIVRVTALCR